MSMRYTSIAEPSCRVRSRPSNRDDNARTRASTMSQEPRLAPIHQVQRRVYGHRTDACDSASAWRCPVSRRPAAGAPPARTLIPFPSERSGAFALSFPTSAPLDGFEHHLDAQTQDRQVQQRLTGGDQACDSGGGVMSPQPTVANMVMVKYNASDRVSGSPNELGSCASRRIDSRDLSRRHRPTPNRRAVVPLAPS